MLIETAVLGPVEVEQENIFTLPEGLYGIDCKGRYALVTRQEDDITLMWLQAVDTKAPCFVVFDPFLLVEGYDPVVEEEDLRFLCCNSRDELEFLAIAVVPDDVREITVNLKSPVALNRKDKLGRQVILSNKDYPISFPLFARDPETV